MNLRTVCVSGILFLSLVGFPNLLSSFSPLQQSEESKSEKAKSGVLESSVKEEAEVHSGSLIWPGALCHSLIPRNVGFVKDLEYTGPIFSYPCKWAQEPESGHTQLWHSVLLRQIKLPGIWPLWG